MQTKPPVYTAVGQVVSGYTRLTQSAQIFQHHNRANSRMSQFRQLKHTFVPSLLHPFWKYIGAISVRFPYRRKNLWSLISPLHAERPKAW